MARYSTALGFLALLVACLGYHGVVEGSHDIVDEGELRQSVAATVVDYTYRTGYHFQPPKMWMNDPNGLMYYKGLYHVFYQYNPKHPYWESPFWAHSVSKDLINWEALEPAIYSTKPFDSSGCWSGSATILPGNKPVVIYTGNNTQGQQVQNIAFPKDLSDPYLREWVKPDYNPVMAPVDWINATQFRDPTTAWLGPDGHWRMLVGSIRKHRGLVILYRSKDFVHWERAKHPLHSVEPSAMWECPDFYPVARNGKEGVDTSARGKGLKYVFKVSLDKIYKDYYTIGSYCWDSDKYTPDGTSPDNLSGLRYDYGSSYASKTFFDPSTKRRIMIAWSNESDSRSDDIKKGWSGIYTIPRVISLDPNGRQLIQWPVEELESLRTKHVSVQSKKVNSNGGTVEISGINTAQSDVEVTFQLSNLAKAEPFNSSWTNPQDLCGEKGADVKGGVGPFGLQALASAKREERTAVFFRIFKAPSKYVTLMCHDPSRSSFSPNLYKPAYGAFVDVDIQENGKISLRSLIDHSVVESFGAGGKVCITSRVYPSRAVGDAAHLFVFNNGSEDVKISELNAWDMKKPLMNGA